MATAKQIKVELAKRQGFSGKILLEHLSPGISPSYEAQEWYCDHYHANEIPAKFFDGDYAVVMAKLAYIDKRGRKHRATVGMLTDGASVPDRLHGVISPPYASPFLPAYLIHDELCQRARDIPDKAMRKRMRKDTDRLFLEMLTYLGAGRLKRRVMYRGVRVGAWWDEVKR